MFGGSNQLGQRELMTNTLSCVVKVQAVEWSGKIPLSMQKIDAHRRSLLEDYQTGSILGRGSTLSTPQAVSHTLSQCGVKVIPISGET